jgi:predicted SprT family Zn-dependent metalloprotease
MKIINLVEELGGVKGGLSKGKRRKELWNERIKETGNKFISTNSQISYNQFVKNKQRASIETPQHEKNTDYRLIINY